MTEAATDEKLVTAASDADARSKRSGSGKLTMVLPGQMVVCGDPRARLATSSLGAAAAARQLLAAAKVPITADPTGGHGARRLALEQKGGLVPVSEAPGEAAGDREGPR